MTGALRRWSLPFVLLALFFVIWELAVGLTDTPAWMLPKPSAIWEAFREDYSLLWRHTRVTLLEVLLGFGVALAAGIAIGIAIDTSRTLERALYPLIIASQTIPMVVLAPLLLIWFGYGLTPKIIVAALIAFFPITVSTVDGLRTADREVMSMLRSFGAGRWDRFRLAKLPAALPSIFSGARIGIAVSVIAAVFGELVGASEGLGYLMQRDSSQFLTARVFASIFILSLMGVGLFGLISGLERLLLPWRRHVTDRPSG
ncbi:MAG TPA: ABC transporter permease [Thermomicrobiales bacterium]|nr:ABC transporter permease [Thermomicrobiales bacterium]